MLAVLQQESEAALKQAKAAKSRLDGALVLKYGTQAAERAAPPARIPAPSGSMDGDVTVVADLPKRVDWDQAQARRDGRAHPRRRRRPGRVRRDQLQGAERNYAAWPTAIREGFEPARTVRPGKLTFRLVSVEEAR